MCIEKGGSEYESDHGVCRCVCAYVCVGIYEYVYACFVAFVIHMCACMLAYACVFVYAQHKHSYVCFCVFSEALFVVVRMKKYNIGPDDRLICFGQLLGMCDNISFPLGESGMLGNGGGS